MIQVRCTQCSAALSLKQSPTSGKVKCPKCAAIISVGTSSAPPIPAAKPSPVTRPPVRPTAQPSFDGEIDFRNIPVASAPLPSGNFPMLGTARVYNGPVTLDPIPTQRANEDDEDDEDDSPSVGTQPSPGKKQTNLVVALAAAAIVLIAVGGFFAWKMSGSAGTAAPDPAAIAAAAAPSGYQAKSLNGCIALMPVGSRYEKMLKSDAIEAEAVSSGATGSVFLLAVMDAGSEPLTPDQMKKKAARALSGEVLGGTSTERNGYKGIKGILDGSASLPRLQLEIFQFEGRFAVIGNISGSEMQAQGGGDAVVVGGSAEEQKEAEVFYNSFKIGPPPSGFFGN